MRVAISLRLAQTDWAEASAYVTEAERLGVDFVWSAEAWGHDGVTPLAFVAARTSRIRLGTGILQAGTRTPALLAMTAMSLSAMSDGRFVLGLGVSGPQVIEGWHGIRFDRPVLRMRETVEILAFELRIANIEVSFDLANELPLVWADAHQLRQVVVNLVTNARQALQDSRPPHRLSLRTRQDAQGQRVRIEVADSGPGVPREVRARIFEPFFTTKPEGEGTGLGLALARGIIESHGGAIDVDCAPGDGACFVIELPVGAPPSPADEREDLSAASPVSGKTILVVDDEPAVASLLAEALSRDGYKVDLAANGAVALRMLGARDYDLIVSDSGMPVLSGPELYREMERREPRLTRRFVFVTGDILNSRTRAFLARTGAPQLEKPFTVESVKRVVRRALLAQ